jgi:hypothetical protein
MNLPIAAPLNTASWRVLVESLGDGQVAAWVVELPDCRVVADSKAAAIAALAPLLNGRMEQMELITLPSTAANPWAAFYGVLKDDADFRTWATQFWEEKQGSHDNEPILSIEECLQVM